MSNSFTVPQDGPVYQERVFRRCQDLIRAGIWSGITLNQLFKWLNNFADEKERYFAACVLDSLIYRSDDQTLALLRQLFQRAVPNLVRSSGLKLKELEECINTLHRSNENVEPQIRIIPVLSASDPVSKSAPTILRKLKRHLNFSERWTAKVEEIPALAKNGIRAFVFVDDFLGTGRQFCSFIKASRISPCMKKTICIYAPAVAHEAGVAKLRKESPYLQVACAELLTNSMGFFSPTMPWFKDGVNSVAGAKAYYFALLKRKGITVDRGKRLGYGSLEVTYAFEHGIPKTSLPLLWWNRTTTWSPLIER